MSTTPPVVVMGVSGSGKTTIGSLLATRIDRRFVDADDLHSIENKSKMASGRPLDDQDRWPWLDAVGSELARNPSPVVACSALRRVYRDRLRMAEPSAWFFCLSTDRSVIEDRLRARSHEYMPASLLDSQLSTLEPLEDDEAGWTLDALADPISIVERIAVRLAEI